MSINQCRARVPCPVSCSGRRSGHYCRSRVISGKTHIFYFLFLKRFGILLTIFFFISYLRIIILLKMSIRIDEFANAAKILIFIDEKHTTSYLGIMHELSRDCQILKENNGKSSRVISAWQIIETRMTMTQHICHERNIS